ncbi:MAG: substrate-binding domain-containing protein, partial [Cyanobacteria bacterium J06642_11]
PSDTDTEVVEAADADVLSLLNEKLQGKRGIYDVQRWLGKRGNGHLFLGEQLGSQQPVVIKEYLLPRNLYSEEEARQRQQAFVHLAGLSRSDERPQDIRILRPLEAIADTRSLERCYLVTEAWDAKDTLHKKLLSEGAFSADQVRNILSQILQTLLVLHQQKVILPSGQFQSGIIHGNLRLDNLLWIEEKVGHSFIYLSDFALWEQLFAVPVQPYQSCAASSPQVIQARDLQAVGRIGYCLLQGVPESQVEPSADRSLPEDDQFLNYFIKRLLQQEGAAFVSAEEAWRALVALPRVPTPLSTAAEITEITSEKRKPGISKTVLLGIIASALTLIGGLAWWFLFRQSDDAIAQDAVPTCCFKDVGAIPAQNFTYTTLEDGVWQFLWSQQNLGQMGQSLGSALIDAQPDLTLNYIPSPSIVEAIAQVQAGDVDFAILPLALAPDLPSDVDSQIIAYDGLAVFVAFSYAERTAGIPNALDGQLALDDLRDLYLGNIDSWRDLGGPWLPVKPYRSDRLEIASIFEQAVLYPADFSRGTLQSIPQLPTLAMLRTIIRDFESEGLGSIGFAPLSQIFGQCSVYPLALQTADKTVVQPWEFTSGKAIDPATDLCDLKGLYHPNIEAFQTGTYPLTYTLSVVYPKDNNRPPVGQKFAELLLTDEGQYLLSEAGLVPLRALWQQERQ